MAMDECATEALRRIPAHEQWAAVGGAISNSLTALHFLVYRKDALRHSSGWPRHRPRVLRAGETLLGWISIGTPKAPARPRGEIDPALVLSSF